MSPTVHFITSDDTLPVTVTVPEHTLVTDAASMAGLNIGQPCAGQGRCGRCIVQVRKGDVHRRSTMRLTPEDVDNGYALACQSLVEGDATIFARSEETIERRLTTERISNGIDIPAGYDFNTSQTIRRCDLSLIAPSLEDQMDDWSRVQTGLVMQHGLTDISCSLAMLRTLGKTLRESDWQVNVIIELDAPDSPHGRILAVRPGLSKQEDPVWAAAVDIGTTTVSFWLVNLSTGKVEAQAFEYNRQIDRGEDVISRIISASKNGPDEMQTRVVTTINELCKSACAQVKAHPGDIIKAVIAANPTMVHLLLGISADSIRLAPFIPSVNQPGQVFARELGLVFHPEAILDLVPGVASYVGGDITAGVLTSRMSENDALSLFIDIGTNGEIVLGNNEWLMTCACSAGPAFEGAGVVHGMRASAGAIDEVWINADTFEPGIRVIGNALPVGICGSGLISLIAELFLTGVLDKSGRFNHSLNSPRVRQTDQGGEYVLVWSNDTPIGKDIVLTRVDVDNLLRAKAAIYAGFSVLLNKVGLTMDAVDQLLIGGSFGKFINLEKAVQIGLLPDIELDQIKYLGNTSLKGAYLALLDWKKLQMLNDIAARMTYVELSADNDFYEEFTSALFLPHTDVDRFESVFETIRELRGKPGSFLILNREMQPAENKQSKN